jgi:hypothetical protein
VPWHLVRRPAVKLISIKLALLAALIEEPNISEDLFESTLIFGYLRFTINYAIGIVVMLSAHVLLHRMMAQELGPRVFLLG